jgi:hypothetical protein
MSVCLSVCLSVNINIYLCVWMWMCVCSHNCCALLFSLSHTGGRTRSARRPPALSLSSVARRKKWAEELLQLPQIHTQTPTQTHRQTQTHTQTPTQPQQLPAKNQFGRGPRIPHMTPPPPSPPRTTMIHTTCPLRPPLATGPQACRPQRCPPSGRK